MRMNLTDEQRAERKARLLQNKRIQDAADATAKAIAPNNISTALAVTITNLACIKAWSKILADYR